MASPDLDAPARVSHLSADKYPSGSVRRCVPFILIFSFAFAGARQCRAQELTQQSQDQAQSQTPDRNSSVAEAARQERARKQNQQKKNQARLHRRGPKPRAHSYPAGSRRVRSAQAPADGSSCRPTKAGRRRQRRNGRTRRPCRIAFREFRRGFAWRRRAALAQRKRITTTSALRGISSSFRGRSPARLTEAVGRALTCFCDRGSSPGSCGCSASDRSVAAVRQAVPPSNGRAFRLRLPALRADLLLDHLRSPLRPTPLVFSRHHWRPCQCHR